MEEERDLRGRQLLRRFLVRTWHDPRSRNDAIWWIAATLFIAAFALAYRTPTRKAAQTPGVRSEPARSEAAEPRIISSDAGPTGKSDKPNAAGEGSDEEPESSVGSDDSPTQSVEKPAPDTQSGVAPEAVRSLDSTARPALATRAHAHVPRLVAATPKMTDIWVTSNPTHPTYTIVDQIVIASSSEAMTPRRLLTTSPEADQTAARIAAFLRLSTVPSLPSTPKDPSSDPSSVGSTPAVVGSFNPTPEPGSLMLLLATVAPLIVRRAARSPNP